MRGSPARSAFPPWFELPFFLKVLFPSLGRFFSLTHVLFALRRFRSTTDNSMDSSMTFLKPFPPRSSWLFQGRCLGGILPEWTSRPFIIELDVVIFSVACSPVPPVSPGTSTRRPRRNAADISSYRRSLDSFSCDEPTGLV